MPGTTSRAPQRKRRCPSPEQSHPKRIRREGVRSRSPSRSRGRCIHHCTGSNTAAAAAAAYRSHAAAQPNPAVGRKQTPPGAPLTFDDILPVMETRRRQMQMQQKMQMRMQLQIGQAFRNRAMQIQLRQMQMQTQQQIAQMTRVVPICEFYSMQHTAAIKAHLQNLLTNIALGLPVPLVHVVQCTRLPKWRPTTLTVCGDRLQLQEKGQVCSDDCPCNQRRTTASTNAQQKLMGEASSDACSESGCTVAGSSKLRKTPSLQQTLAMQMETQEVKCCAPKKSNLSKRCDMAIKTPHLQVQNIAPKPSNTEEMCRDNGYVCSLDCLLTRKAQMARTTANWKRMIAALHKRLSESRCTMANTPESIKTRALHYQW